MKTEKYSLTLYIVGQTQKARRAIENITKYCEEHLKGKYKTMLIKKKNLGRNNISIANSY